MKPTTSWLAEEYGQASVETALFIPVFLLVMALLIQPIALLYSKSIAYQAAQETARIVQTEPPVPAQTIAQYALRRLEAVPKIALFSADPWTVDIAQSDGTVRRGQFVSIWGYARLLPIPGLREAMRGLLDDGDPELTVFSEADPGPDWTRDISHEDLSAWD